MAKRSVLKSIEELEEAEKKRREKYKERKKQLKARLQKQQAREQSRERKRDTRRKILVGSWVMGQLEAGREVALANQEQLLKELDKFLTRKLDRELFELS